MRKIHLELPHHVIGAPQPEQLLRGVGLVGLGQLRAVRGVILLLQLEERLDIGDISSGVSPGGGQGAHASSAAVRD